MLHGLFDWTDGNLWEIARHNVTADEAEQAATDPSLLFQSVAVDLCSGETRYAGVGETVAGRVLGVVFIERSGMLRVITAYPATRRMQRLYREQESQE